jgi:hypothetical protein
LLADGCTPDIPPTDGPDMRSGKPKAKIPPKKKNPAPAFLYGHNARNAVHGDLIRDLNYVAAAPMPHLFQYFWQKAELTYG